MKRKLLRSVVGWMIVLLPVQLLAWGRQGHQLIAQMAMYRISPEARANVLAILNGMTAAEAGPWMDNVRRDSAYRHMSTWHFINIEKGATYQPAPGENIMNALNKAYSELRQREERQLSPEQVKLDVLILFHLCGDLLQPLHVGYGADKGGNDMQVQFNGKGTNLHHIWDTEIIEDQHITLASLLDTTKAPSRRSIRKRRRQQVDFTHWLQAGRRYLPAIYAFEGHQLDEAYMQQHKALVENQLKAGSQLLATCLEQLFGRHGKR